MVDVGDLDDVINVVKEGVDITRVAEKTWDARDAGEAHGVGDGLEDFVRLTADVFVQICRATMAGEDGFLGSLSGFQTRLPTGMGAVRDDEVAVCG